MKEFLRVGIASVCGIVAAFFLLLSVAFPFVMRDVVQKDRAYYRQFEAAGRYALDYAKRHNGALPTDEALQGLGDQHDAHAIWGSVTASPYDCGTQFRPDPSDKVTLSFWRGEWNECFAFPSRKTTLITSTSDYLRSGGANHWLVFLLIGVAAAAVSFRLGRSD